MPKELKKQRTRFCMEDQIQFIAKVGKWVAIKKLSITDKTEPFTVACFLATLDDTFDRKIKDNLSERVDFKRIDEFIKEISGKKGKKTEEEIAKLLKEMSGAKLTRVINSAINTDGLEKKEAKALQEFGKVYATRAILDAIGLHYAYNSVAKQLTPPKKIKG